MKKSNQILTVVFSLILTITVGFINESTPNVEPERSNIVYAFDMDQIMSNSEYSTVVASGGTCTADCSGCWTNECTTSNTFKCGSIQGTQSGEIITCYRGGGNN